MIFEDPPLTAITCSSATRVITRDPVLYNTGTPLIASMASFRLEKRLAALRPM